MMKAKLCSFAIAGAIGLLAISPVMPMASQTQTESTTLTEKKNDQKMKKADLEKKMKAAEEKWNTLTDEQKKEVYALLEAEIASENSVLEKLVELGVLDQADMEAVRSFQLEKFNKMRENGSFPFSKCKGRK